MHSAAGRRGARGDVDAIVGSGVRVAAKEGTGHDLGEGVGAAGDVTADDVGVVRLVGGAVSGVACQDALTEPWGKALDLALDRVRHVFRRTVRDVAIGPAGL